MTVYGKKTVVELEPGDLNGDSAVNAMDANVMKRIVAGIITPTDAQLRAADLDGNGEFNSVDSNVLARIVAGAN